MPKTERDPERVGHTQPTASFGASGLLTLLQSLGTMLQEALTTFGVLVLLILLVAAEIYGLVRLSIRIAIIDNTTTKVALFLAVFLVLVPFVFVFNFYLIYYLGGGH